MFDLLLLEGKLMWNIPLLICLIGIVIVYGFFLHRLTDLKVYHRRPILFFFGLSLLYLMVGSPLTTISHFSFSLHMIQMSILYFIVPPIILIGIPNSLFQTIQKIPNVPKLSPFVLSPKIALSTFAILFLIYHLPFILTIFSQYTFVHHGYILVLIILSFKMWWPLVSPDPSQRLRHDRLKRYTFLSGILLMPACLLFIVSALMDGTSNPFLTQLTAHLCLPGDSNSLSLLPYPFHTTYDQVMAGFFMLGIHKMSLVVTSKISTKSVNIK